MIGALRMGFEVVTQTVTDDWGRINGADSVAIEVPEWVTRDRPYLMIITDADYNPLGTADMFHPTDAYGMLTRSGEIRRHPLGTACPSLIGEAGEFYFLTGNTSALRSGEVVTIAGRAQESSACGAGTAIEIATVKAGRTP
jgi:hypothetical protein